MYVCMYVCICGLYCFRFLLQRIGLGSGGAVHGLYEKNRIRLGYVLTYLLTY